MQEPDPLKPHFNAVVKAIFERRLIPFLGAAAGRCDQPQATWDPKLNQVVPSTAELTLHLARHYEYPQTKEELLQLARVSQYVAVMHGLDPLYTWLQEIFNQDFKPTILHQFFAGLPEFFRKRKIKQVKNPMRQRLVIVTTNYDDLLEQAFNDVGEPYHKLVYMANAGEDISYQGKFLHWAPDGTLNAKGVTNDRDSMALYEDKHKVEPYPVIIKIHGAVDRTPPPNKYDTSPLNPSYVITEDHYIDYLTQTDFFDLLPKSLGAALKKNNFLFLGYSLQDWNLRVILRRIWKAQTLDFSSWAVQLNTSYLDKKYWGKQNVEIVNMELGNYIRQLKKYLEAKDG